MYRFLSTLRGSPSDPPPIWLMRQAGRYLPEYRDVRAQAGGFLNLCYDPEKAAAVTLQPIERFGFDAAIIFSDILVVPHALGAQLSFQEGEGPRLEPVRTSKDAARLSDGLDRKRTEPVYEALALVRRQLDPSRALIGFAGAPWTLAAYLAEGHGSKEFEAARRWALADPEGFGALIDKLTAAVADHLIGQIEAGADAVQIFDSWAGVLPPASFDRWVITPTAAIVTRVRAARPKTPIVGFPRGAGVNYAAYAEKTGVDAVSLDTSVPLAWAVKAIKPSVVLQGNLDPQVLVVGGAALRDGVMDILDATRGRAFVFNLGHGVVPQTPPEHVAELVRLVRGRA
jgi:uroporphyrinogen decarboxylase